MEILDSITVRTSGKPSRIELCQGDLTALAESERVDLLVVSAFPSDYTTTPTSLIGALSLKGVSVARLANRKAVDLRQAFSCWLSTDLENNPPGIPYKRILCFEPSERGRPPELVGDIFRALAPFLSGPPALDTVAMPLVAAGDQGYSVEEMLLPLVDAAFRWMQIGMPLSVLKIVIKQETTAKLAQRAFHQLKQTLGLGTLAQKPTGYDVFISYSHEDSKVANLLLSRLSACSLRVFLDRQDIEEGSAWQPAIFAGIDQCKKFLALLSPSYVSSKICQEEFNIAWARGRKLGSNTIFPVYWRSADLPTYMSMLVFTDCREEVAENLEDACTRLTELCRG